MPSVIIHRPRIHKEHFWCQIAAQNRERLPFVCNERNGEEYMEFRYYILSKHLTAKRFADAVRSHWAIENRLHWQLDEDQFRIRKNKADANFCTLRRTAISLLKNNKSLKVRVNNKRRAAGWGEDYLQELVFGK